MAILKGVICKKDDFDLLTSSDLHLGQGHSKSKRLVSGLVQPFHKISQTFGQ